MILLQALFLFLCLRFLLGFRWPYKERLWDNDNDSFVVQFITIAEIGALLPILIVLNKVHGLLIIPVYFLIKRSGGGYWWHFLAGSTLSAWIIVAVKLWQS